MTYGILAVTELYNKQNNPNFSSELCVFTVQTAVVDEQGESTDPAAGVAILLSRRMRTYIDKSGHVGTNVRGFHDNFDLRR